MKVLVFGGCGFLGSNLASEALRRGHELVVYDSLGRRGSDRNLAWLEELGGFRMYQEDIRDADTVARAVREFRPDVVFHTAGQVAMTTSLADPRLDFETNAVGTFNILEAIRLHSPDSIITYSSTNKVYGDLEGYRYTETATRYVCEDFPKGFPEDVPLDFRTPYGCSKGSADQYIGDYALSYGLRSVVFRHSSIFGGRQFATSDQGWIGWFVQQALETAAAPGRDPFTISGNGKQVRDVLFASDLITCYFEAIEQIDRTSGEVFNIGGGFENSLSLLELFEFLEGELGIKLHYDRLPPRESDQKVFVADVAKAGAVFGWQPQVDKESGLRQMIDWVGSTLRPRNL
jgi:CDP-paratose 2-epimerase